MCRLLHTRPGGVHSDLSGGDLSEGAPLSAAHRLDFPDQR